MLRLLQISDLHFGPPYLPQVGEALLAIAPELEPDAVLICGDLTQRAKPEQFIEAKAFLERLPDVPRLVIPGNHDVPLYRIRERLCEPLGQYQKYISKDLNQVLRIESAVIVGLDTTSPHRAISNGRIDNWQLDLCTAAFATAPEDAVRIVAVHHHFAPAPDYLRDSSMPKARRAIERFVELGVELILGGHLHRAFIGNSLDFYPGVHRERGVIIIQSGTATSRRGRGREREKNSFNLIQIDDSSVVVTHYIYFHELPGFAPMSRHQFRRPGRPFAAMPHPADVEMSAFVP